jgi:hypothetical protein
VLGRNIKGKVLPKGFSGVKETRPHEEDKGWCLYNLVFLLWVGQFLEKKSQRYIAIILRLQV